MAGPRPDPVLPKDKGLNRFVWDMRYATMAGRAERSHRRRFRRDTKRPPGKYSVTLKMGGQTRLNRS